MDGLRAPSRPGSTWECLDAGGEHALLALYYDELRRLARHALRGQAGRITLQPTDLAHEAALRLIGSEALRGSPIRDEGHLLSLAARVIRTTFIDEIRRRRALKREVRAVTLWEDCAAAPEIDVLRFDELLERLAGFEPEGAKVVELRFYVGMTMAEIAETLGLSERSVHRRWHAARAWLLRELLDA